MTQINKVLSKQVGREITGNPGSITMEEAVTLFERDLALYAFSQSPANIAVNIVLNLATPPTPIWNAIFSNAI